MLSEEGYWTCPQLDHRRAEDWWRLHDKATFTIKPYALARARADQPEDALEPAPEATDTIDLPADTATAPEANVNANPMPSPSDPFPTSTPPPCPSKPSTGHRLCLMFGHRHKHNEQQAVWYHSLLRDILWL